MIYPSRGQVLIKVILPEGVTRAGVVTTQTTTEEPMYGKILEIGKPAVRDGAIVDAPSFVVGTDKENLGGRNHKLRKGDVVVFRQHSQQELIDQVEVDEKIAFLDFDHILGIKLEDK